MAQKQSSGSYVTVATSRLIQEIVSLAVKISATTEHDVFVGWSGHVLLLDVRVYINGWAETKQRDFVKEIFVNRNTAISAGCIGELRDVVSYLKELKECVKVAV